MALIKKFDSGKIDDFIDNHAKQIRLSILNVLQFVGERFIVNSRSNDTYKDRTGNLRSSIGYVIAVDGVVQAHNFPGEGSQGVGQGRSVADNALLKFPTGMALIVVAGMGYAAAVESRGYDVISVGSIQAGEDLKKELSALQKTIAS